MTMERDEIRGVWIATDTIDGYMVTRRYYGYTKQEAAQQWAEEFGNE